MTEQSVHPMTKAARALTAILNLSGELREQAVNDANAQEDRHSLPGGKAMIALAHVANQEAWTNRYMAAEHFGRDAAYIEVEDDSWEPPLQTLCFWSEQWRAETGMEYDTVPTLETEAKWLKYNLDWAWSNELHFEDFLRDLAKARVRMENMLQEGERAERGVPCMYDSCGGTRLVRKLVPARDPETGLKTWRHTEWHCPSCHREWSDERYQASIAAAAWAAQSEEIDGEIWCSPKYAARQVERTESCVRGWLTRHEWPTACIVRGRRSGFLRLADVEEHAEQAKRRKRAA